jgi:hypothetical protein
MKRPRVSEEGSSEGVRWDAIPLDLWYYFPISLADIKNMRLTCSYLASRLTTLLTRRSMCNITKAIPNLFAHLASCISVAYFNSTKAFVTFQKSLKSGKLVCPQLREFVFSHIILGILNCSIHWGPDAVHSIRFSSTKRDSFLDINDYGPVHSTFRHLLSEWSTADMFPSSLRTLRLSHNFHRRLQVGMLPAGLLTLLMPDSYVYSFMRDVLPVSLRTLCAGTPKHWGKRSLPPHLERLEYVDCTGSTNTLLLPLSLKWLRVSYRCSVVVGFGCFQASALQIMEIDARLSIASFEVIANHLPPTLAFLRLWYDRSIEMVPLLPSTLRYLELQISFGHIVTADLPNYIETCIWENKELAESSFASVRGRPAKWVTSKEVRALRAQYYAEICGPGGWWK